MKEYIPFAVRYRFRTSLDRITGAKARLAQRAAIADGRVSHAYYDWYLSRSFAPLRALLPPGALAFDVGANVGTWTGMLRSFGCRVVAVEPQPDCLERLRSRYAQDPSVTVVAAAVAESTGEVELYVGRSSEHATTSRRWIADMTERAGYDPTYWRIAGLVHAVTLDDLIAEFGKPDYVKLDVEGSESRALAGLSEALPLLSFETHGETVDDARACIDRLDGIGTYAFNLTPGDLPTLLWPDWRGRENVLRAVAEHPHGWNNVFARRV